MSQTNGTEALVKTKTINWKELVLRKWGKDWAKPEPAYEFTGRTFEAPKLPSLYDPTPRWNRLNTWDTWDSWE